MVGIIVKKYEHVNRSFGNWNTPKGKYISSRKQYNEEMAKGGFVSFEDGSEMAQAASKRKEYRGISPKAMEICQQAKNLSDRKGNIAWTPKLVEAMKDVGVGFDYYDKLPKHYQPQGGFTEEI